MVSRKRRSRCLGWYRSEWRIIFSSFRKGQMQKLLSFFETIEEEDEDLLCSLLNTWYEEGDLFLGRSSYLCCR